MLRVRPDWTKLHGADKFRPLGFALSLLLILKEEQSHDKKFNSAY